ncbi:MULTISPECIES: hypothetical protein [Pandoraea]|uniref:Uncharacterized protein n=2 Tax=Pandoraea TaxID=93217 RepID=A0A5E4XF56_9BURK|nr:MULTISPECIES: hypothetical protein [Pandoraea]VVE17178.1 hypothetical protein PCE31107_02956 [Pandoraea cepalis]VVE34956.1 hypothetical protein PTE31013_03876 [Pandoraea terrigena]
MNSNIQPQKQSVHRYQVGMQVVDSDEKILGEITSLVQEDGRIFAVVNGDYEVDLAGSSEVIDLTGTARAYNPALKPSWIRLNALTRRV